MCVWVSVGAAARDEKIHCTTNKSTNASAALSQKMTHAWTTQSFIINNHRWNPRIFQGPKDFICYNRHKYIFFWKWHKYNIHPIICKSEQIHRLTLSQLQITISTNWNWARYHSITWTDKLIANTTHLINSNLIEWWNTNSPLCISHNFFLLLSPVHDTF